MKPQNGRLLLSSTRLGLNPLQELQRVMEAIREGSIQTTNIRLHGLVWATSSRAYSGKKKFPNYGTTVWQNIGEVDEWGSSYTIGNLDIGSKYRWRMRHISPLGEEGAWTAFVEFNYAFPDGCYTRTYRRWTMTTPTSNSIRIYWTTSGRFFH